AELKRLRATGEIQNYIFLWDDESSRWQPIEAPPPPPKARQARAGDQRPLEVLCHDARHSLVRGTLRKISDREGELSTVVDSLAPPLPLQCLLRMNVLEPESQRSINIKVRLSDLSRQGGSWFYRVHWIEPTVLSLAG